MVEASGFELTALRDESSLRALRQVYIVSFGAGYSETRLEGAIETSLNHSLIWGGTEVTENAHQVVIFIEFVYLEDRISKAFHHAQRFFRETQTPRPLLSKESGGLIIRASRSPSLILKLTSTRREERPAATPLVPGSLR